MALEVQRRFRQAHCGHEPVFRESFPGARGVLRRRSLPMSIQMSWMSYMNVYDVCMTIYTFVFIPRDPSTLKSVWGIIYYDLGA